jgi:hypothetical protein
MRPTLRKTPHHGPPSATCPIARTSAFPGGYIEAYVGFTRMWNASKKGQSGWGGFVMRPRAKVSEPSR